MEELLIYIGIFIAFTAFAREFLYSKKWREEELELRRKKIEMADRSADEFIAKCGGRRLRRDYIDGRRVS